MVKTNNKGREAELTILGEGMKVTGELITSDDIRIDGVFAGELKTQGRIVVAPKGYVEGNVRGKTITINGNGKGEFQAEHNFELTSRGEFTGTVKTKFINITETAVFEGTCVISQNTTPHPHDHLRNGFFSRKQQMREDTFDLKPEKAAKKKDTRSENEYANNPETVKMKEDKMEQEPVLERKVNTLLNNKISQIKSL
jgi:cytoskeletal protein CcmA (bactofilin family)